MVREYVPNLATGVSPPPLPEDMLAPVGELPDALVQPVHQHAEPNVLCGGDGQQATLHQTPQLTRLHYSNQNNYSPTTTINYKKVGGQRYLEQ